MIGQPAPTFEARPADWLSYTEALDRVLSAARPCPIERVAVAEALGRVLAEDIVATATLPPWDNSAMDGYAVRARDIRGASPSNPMTLNVIGASHAGTPQEWRVGDGEAIRIMTGAPLPGGADSVVRVEDTDRETEGGLVTVRDDRDAGRNVRSGGEDMVPGQTVLRSGTPVHAGSVGVIAAAGFSEVGVHGRVAVSVVTTGDELRTVEQYDDVRAGRGVPESNGPMLAAAVRTAGGIPRQFPAVPDDPGLLRDALIAAAKGDVVVTVGGASMGEADLVKRVLDAIGFRQDFWRVRIRPGSPFSFGWVDAGDGREVPVFGLPGNPASAFVTFDLFVRPFLRRMSGHESTGRRRIRAVAGQKMSAPAELTYFLRVRLEPGETRTDPPIATLTGSQNSGLVESLGLLHGLAVVPPDVSEIAPGDPVEVILFEEAWGGDGR